MRKVPKEVEPELAKILAGQPEPDAEGVAAMREEASRTQAPWSERAAELVNVERTAVRGAEDDRPLWVVSDREAEPSGAPVLYVHGGGWTLCDLRTHLAVVAGLARASGREVHAVDQRRAPEDPYPAPLLDAAAAVRAMSEGHPDGFFLAGDSAGANLSLAALLYLNDRGETHTVAGMLLYYGCFRRVFDTASHRDYGGGPYGLTTDDMRFLWDTYVGDAEGGGRFADLSGCDFRGLPPAQVHVAELDCLADDSRWLAEELRKAGGKPELVTWPGVTHGFLHYSPALERANLAFGVSARFLEKRATGR